MINFYKIIKSFSSILLLMFLLSPQVMASEPALTEEQMAAISKMVNENVEEELKIENIDELQQDLANRLILGVFGKDALIYSLGDNVADNVISEIEMLSMNEVQRYAKPFNVGNLNGLLMILASFFFVAFSVLTIYFAWVMFEGLFNTQDSGEFFGQRTSTLFSVLKGSTAMFLIIPAYGFSHKPFSDFQNSIDGTSYGSFSIAQLFVFKSAGFSNQFSNQIWGSFVNNYQKAFPTIMLPNTHAKEVEMKNLLNYVMCVKSYNTGETTKFYVDRLKESSGNYTIFGSYKSCTIEGSIKYDLTTVKEMQKESEFSSLVNGVVDYDAIFASTVNKVISKSVEKANIYADLILEEFSGLTESNEKTGILVNPKNWQAMCEVPTLMFEKGKLNRDSLPTVQYYMEKCLSEEFILGFIADNKMEARSFYSNSIFKNNMTPVCDDLVAVSQGQRTLVKTNENATFENNLSKTLSQCLTETCGGVLSGDSGLYQCTSTIEFAKTNTENARMIRQGWLTAGAYSYALFSGFTNNTAQELVNSLNLSFNVSSKKLIFKPDEFAYDITSTNTLDKKIINDFGSLLEMPLKTNDTNEARQDSVGALMPSTGFLGSGGDDGWFGITKFVTCSNKPMSVTDGFVCGNVTEELHDMGVKMFTIAVEIKIAQSASQMFGHIMKGNTSEINKQFGKMSGKAKKFLGGSDSMFKSFLGIVGLGSFTTVVGVNAFSEIDAYWVQNPEIYMVVIALLSGQVPFIEAFMDFAFGILLILGLIFGFLLPLLPYFLWLIVVSGWAVMIIESLIVAPVWAATLISPSNDHTSKTAKKGLLILLTIIMRAPFMVVGLVLAWLLSNNLIGALLEISNISDALLLSAGTTSIAGFIDMFVKLIVYLSLIYFIYNLVFSIIEGFYEIGVNWLFSSSLSPFAAKDRSEKWRSGYSSAKKFVGVK